MHCQVYSTVHIILIIWNRNVFSPFRVNFRKLSCFKYWKMICIATFLRNHFVLKSLTHSPLWDVEDILKVLTLSFKSAIFKHNPMAPILHLSNEITFWWMPENLSDQSILDRVMTWYLLHNRGIEVKQTKSLKLEQPNSCSCKTYIISMMNE